MNDYLLRFPEDTPPMTYEALAARLADLCDRANCLSDYIEIGTTVQVRWTGRSHDEILVRLYQTTIAILTADGTVRFPNDDPHQATTAWIEKIVRDNGLGYRVSRIRRHASDGPGPETAARRRRLPGGGGLSRTRIPGHAGLLVIDGDRGKPVHGRAWTREQVPAWWPR